MDDIESTKPDPLPRAELERQLDNALEQTFPASDPVTIGEPTTSEPERPVHCRPAQLDTELVNELAKNVAAKHKKARGGA